jgi:endonuclease/exonuclease/phosphatase family metal-dependent hydrolase
MKLMQLNAWGGRLEYLVEELIRQEKPDILCLQEAVSFDKAGSGMFLPIEGMQKAHKLPYVAFGPEYSYNLMGKTAHFGNGILSTEHILKTEVFYTYLDHNPDFQWGRDNGNIRNVVHAVIEINGKQCHVLTHHGFWIHEHKNGNDETLRQMGILADYISALEGPIILTGDFNLVSDSPSLDLINDKLTNLSVKYALPTTRTDLTRKKETCDYIFVNDEVRVESFEALEDIASDHKALVMNFSL